MSETHLTNAPDPTATLAAETPLRRGRGRPRKDGSTPSAPPAESCGLPGLEAVCRARGWSLGRAALELQEFPNAVYKWARGQASPSAGAIVRLARKLNVSADVLLGLAPVNPSDTASPQE